MQLTALFLVNQVLRPFLDEFYLRLWIASRPDLVMEKESHSLYSLEDKAPFVTASQRKAISLSTPWCLRRVVLLAFVLVWHCATLKPFFVDQFLFAGWNCFEEKSFSTGDVFWYWFIQRYAIYAKDLYKIELAGEYFGLQSVANIFAWHICVVSLTCLTVVIFLRGTYQHGVPYLVQCMEAWLHARLTGAL